MASLWIEQRFKLFWIGKHHCLDEMYNVFLGFANFYRKFIKDYSKIVLPLTELTQKNRPFVPIWGFKASIYICTNFEARWSKEALYTRSWCIWLRTRKRAIPNWRWWPTAPCGFSFTETWSRKNQLWDSGQRASRHCGFFSTMASFLGGFFSTDYCLQWSQKSNILPKCSSLESSTSSLGAILNSFVS